MTLRLVLVFTIPGILAIENERKSYSGYQIWEVNGNMTEKNVSKFDDRDVWERDNNTFNFLLNGNETESWVEYLNTQNMSYKVLLSDVQARIDELALESRRGTPNTLPWSKQPTLAEIIKSLKKIAAANPSHCTLTSIGKTVYKNEIYLFKISNGNKNNKAILIDVGSHGREWTAVLAGLYFIESIAGNFSQQSDAVQHLDWYILPLMNPDGYAHSMTTDRLWRKNRRRFSGPCDGVDLNRNFAYGWGQKGSSSNICSPLYCGPEAFSEEETKAFRHLVMGNHFLVYIALHSSGSKVLYPSNYNRDATPEWRNHVAVTREMVMAMRSVAQTQYVNGNIQKMGVDRWSGISIDWMYFDQKITHSYLMETRGRMGLDLLEWHEVSVAVREVRAGLMRLAELCYHK